MMKVFVILFFTFLFSCSRSGVPRDIVEPEKMKLVLFDMVRADEFANNYVVNDSAKNKRDETFLLYEQVFRIHKINKEQFYKSYSYYQQNPDKNKALYDSINAYATRKKIAPSTPPKQKEIKQLQPND